MSLSDAWRSAPLGLSERHAEALTLMATRMLRAGDVPAALDFIDRRCRLDEAPSAADHAIRALAAHLSGLKRRAEHDLARALATDPLDPFLATVRLRLAPDGAAAGAAAAAILASPLATAPARRAALAHMFAEGPRAFADLDVMDERLSGFAVWAKGAAAAMLFLFRGGREHGVQLAADPAFPLAGDDAEGCFVDLPLGFAATSYRLTGASSDRCEGHLWPKRRTAVARPRRGGAAIPPRAALTVIVPVYRDRAATTACLASLVADAKGRPSTRVVVVDDASPDPGIVADLADLEAAGAILLIRHPANLGFIGAVRSGLAQAGGDDILLLNADTELPPGALDRLAEAVYGAADIGTATPWSNNGEYTSFPRHAEAGKVSGEAARRIDGAAARVNGSLVVDLPNGVGFCLYIRHDCLAAVGGLSERYHRGYFEDLDFCLRARRAGYRNVCATFLHVTHWGTLSFGAEKRGLVARNLRVLRQRFPLFQAECAAYARADPLFAARGAIEAAIPPSGNPRLIAGPEGSPAATERLFRLRTEVPAPLRLAWRTVGGRTLIRIRGSGETGPCSLDFALPDGGESLARYIAALDPAAIEIAGAEIPDRMLVDILAGTARLPDILLGDLPAGLRPSRAAPDGPMPESPPKSPLTAGWEAWRNALKDRCGRPVALDAPSLAAVRRALADGGPEVIDACVMSRSAMPSAKVAGHALPGLGILMAAPSPEADGFVRALSAGLRQNGARARIVVLGRALDDLGLMARGNVFVTGAIAAADHCEVVAQYGVTALALPYSSGHRALLERVAAETALPAACTDWSLGDCAAEPPSLVLEAAASVRDTATRIVDWFADRLAA